MYWLVNGTRSPVRFQDWITWFGSDVVFISLERSFLCLESPFLGERSLLLIWCGHVISVNWTDKMPVVESFRPAFKKTLACFNWQKLNVSDASLLDWNKLWQGNLQKQPLFCVFVPFTVYSTCTYVSLWDWQPLHLRLWSYGFENTLHAKKEKSCLSSQRPFLLRSFLFPLSILFIDFPCLSLSFTKSGNFHIHPLFIYFRFS